MWGSTLSRSHNAATQGTIALPHPTCRTACLSKIPYRVSSQSINSSSPSRTPFPRGSVPCSSLTTLPSSSPPAGPRTSPPSTGSGSWPGCGRAFAVGAIPSIAVRRASSPLRARASSSSGASIPRPSCRIWRKSRPQGGNSTSSTPSMPTRPRGWSPACPPCATVWRRSSGWRTPSARSGSSGVAIPSSWAAA